MFSGVMNHASPSASLTDESGFGRCYLHQCIPTVKCVGAVFHGSGPLVPLKGNLNATAYNDILDDSVLLTLWQQFGEGPFLFSAWQCHRAQSRDPYKNSLSKLPWKKLTGLQRALTSTPSNTSWDEFVRRLHFKCFTQYCIPNGTLFPIYCTTFRPEPYGTLFPI